MVGQGAVRLYLVMYGFVMQVRYGNVAYCDVWLCKAVMVGQGAVR
jgi:hypothetical protein